MSAELKYELPPIINPSTLGAINNNWHNHQMYSHQLVNNNNEIHTASKILQPYKPINL